MKNTQSFVIFLAFISWSASYGATSVSPACVVSDSAPNPNTYTIHTITYEKVRGEPVLLDLYAPKAVTNPPLIVLVHGGGWSADSRTLYSKLAAQFTSYGYAAATVDYRLVDAKEGQNLFPAAVQDVRCAVRFLRYHAEVYHFNGKKIGAFGGSAGGNLVGMLGAAGNSNGIDGADLDGPYCSKGYSDTSPEVQVVADYYGLNTASDPAAFNSAQERNFGNYVGAKDPVNSLPGVQASPLKYINAKTPPFMIVHGLVDKTMPIAQSTDLAAALSEAGVASEFVAVPGVGHNFLPFTTSYDGAVIPSTCAMLGMFEKYLKLAP